MTNWKELVGSRCLVKEPYTYKMEADEVKILEVSKSEKYVKIEWIITGFKTWKEVDQLELMEVLEEG